MSSAGHRGTADTGHSPLHLPSAGGGTPLWAASPPRDRAEHGGAEFYLIQTSGYIRAYPSQDMVKALAAGTTACSIASPPTSIGSRLAVSLESTASSGLLSKSWIGADRRFASFRHDAAARSIIERRTLGAYMPEAQLRQTALPTSAGVAGLPP